MTVTVLLVIHNAEKYIEECIKSILNQSFQDFELLIVDDGSSDKTVNIIKKQKNKHIRLICNSHNYISSLNLGLNESRGKYIARMDGDDIMHKNRLEKQVKIMEDNENITVCSSWMKCFGLCDMSIDNYNGIINNIICELVLGNVIMHPTTMIRMDFLRKYNIYYNKNYPYAEDYKLWCDIAINKGVFCVIPEHLLYYRCSEMQISHLKKSTQKETAIKIQKEIIEYIINKNNSQETFQLYKNLLLFYNNKSLSFNTLCITMYEILSTL